MFEKLKRQWTESWRINQKLGPAQRMLIERKSLSDMISAIKMHEFYADVDTVPSLLAIVRNKRGFYSQYYSQLLPHARRALLKVKDPKAVELFLSALNDENKEVQTVATTALGQFREKRAVEPLIALLRNSHVHREILVTTFIQLRDERAVDPLIALLTDTYKAWGKERYKLGELLVTAIVQLGGARAVRPLTALFQNCYSSRLACNTLVKLLESIAAEVDQEDLRILANIKSVPVYVEDDFLDFGQSNFQHLVPSQMIQLAQQELFRRGLEVL